MHHHPHPHAPGDDHSHGHEHGHVPSSLGRALLITIIFMVVELAGGVYANSLALISDGAHMLTDVGAMVLSLVVYWVTRRPSTPKMSFGYQRLEILGALLSGLAIWMIAGYLVYEAVLRMADPPEVKGPVVFVVAVFGLGANLLSMRALLRAKEGNMNVRAAYLHLMADAIGSVGAIIAGGVLWATGWRPIDPIVTVIFAGLMVVSSWELVRESVAVLMESAPSHVKPEDVRKDLSGLTGVSEVHDLHIWTVSSGRLALSVHLIALDDEQILHAANAILSERYGIVHTTIQVEHPDRFKSERCYDCAP